MQRHPLGLATREDGVEPGSAPEPKVRNRVRLTDNMREPERHAEHEPTRFATAAVILLVHHLAYTCEQVTHLLLYSLEVVVGPVVRLVAFVFSVRAPVERCAAWSPASQSTRNAWYPGPAVDVFAEHTRSPKSSWKNSTSSSAGCSWMQKRSSRCRVRSSRANTGSEDRCFAYFPIASATEDHDRPANVDAGSSDVESETHRSPFPSPGWTGRLGSYSPRGTYEATAGVQRRRSARRSRSRASTSRRPASRPMMASGLERRAIRIPPSTTENVISSPTLRPAVFRSASGITTCPLEPMR